MATRAPRGWRTSTAKGTRVQLGGTTADAASPACAPLTGWDRARWADLADALLLAARPYGSPGHARIVPPGAEGGYGRAVDGLEGFARTFLLAGFRLAGERGADPLGLADWYAAGLASGTDPRSPERWVRLDEHGQAKVEAASLALVLDLTRPWLWDRLDSSVQERVVEYLAPAVGDDTYPRINWVWFRLVVQTFLRSVGGPHSLDEMAADLATHDTFRRADGWLADGDERSFDHYTGWALHLYPTLWARMAGAEDLAAPRAARDRDQLDRYLQDAVALVGADGAPLLQGRSLAYRFAAAAPFWVGALAEVPSVPLGVLRRAASGVVSHFVAHGAPDARGLLTLGWHHEWPQLAQSYSGPSSPYWASKGLLGLALPADHPAWLATELPLPVEEGDVLRAVRAPGWVVSGTHADGIVRVVNHGTDHAREGARGGDSPLYARLGYSTATSPLLDDAAWSGPADQSVVLLDAAGRGSHRTGWRVAGEAYVDGGVAVAGSVADAHWLEPDPPGPRHGSGLTGTAVAAGQVGVISLVRGPWELRLIRLADLATSVVAVRVGGWPLAGPGAEVSVGGDSCAVERGRLHSAVTLVPVRTRDGDDLSRVPPPRAESAIVTAVAASPLGDPAAVPVLVLEPRDGWCAVLVELGGLPAPAGAPCALDLDVAAGRAEVTWPDAVRLSTRLPSLDVRLR